MSEKINDSALKKAKKQRIQLYSGIIGFVILLMLPSPQGLSTNGKNVLVLLLFQMYLLVTRVMPFGVVGLLPVVIIPILGILGTKIDKELLVSAVLGYSNDIIFLVMSGFMIGGVMQKWGLHKRVSYGIAAKIGNKPSTILLAFMIASAFISMFLTNTATVVMMMPVALAFIKATDLKEGNLFAAALVTSISYSANMGGVGTPTGSSLSAGAIGIIPQLTGHDFNYTMYLAIGVPYAIISIFMAWLILKWIYKPDKATGIENVQKDVILEARKNLGKITKTETYISIILLIMFMGILTRPLIWGKYLPKVSDGVFVTFVSLIMFLVPVDKEEYLYTWSDAKRDIDVGMLLMIGGFLTLGSLLGPTGVTSYLADLISKIEGINGIAGVYLIGGITNFLSNFGVNMFAALPLSHAVATGMNLNIPLTLFVVTCVAQLNISLPERATNALSIGTGYATPGQLLKGGILISISNVLIAPIIIYFITMGIFGVGTGW
ncbi:SLC13 family permease [Tissierella praeacuta]|uniref:SLC13 family permease n=1 Tax=Tissierella praeacuta TaxID=43131 RepID=UPI003513FE15